MNTNSFPLTTTPLAVAPFTECWILVSATLVGAITLGPMTEGRGPFTLPAGTAAGAYKVSSGGSDIPTTAVCSSGSDAGKATIVWAPWDSLSTGSGNGVLLRSPSGALSATSITAGVIGIPTALRGSLTLRAPSGWSQTISAGTSGVVALTGLPSGVGATWQFNAADDAYGCQVVAGLTN